VVKNGILFIGGEYFNKISGQKDKHTGVFISYSF